MLTIILDNLVDGLGREELLRSYPMLEPVHIEAALAVRSSRRSGLGPRAGVGTATDLATESVAARSGIGSRWSAPPEEELVLVRLNAACAIATPQR